MIKIITTKEYTELSASREKLQNANKQLAVTYAMVNALKYENEQTRKYVEDLELKNNILQDEIDDLFYGNTLN